MPRGLLEEFVNHDGEGAHSDEIYGSSLRQRGKGAANTAVGTGILPHMRLVRAPHCSFADFLGSAGNPQDDDYEMQDLMAARQQMEAKALNELEAAENEQMQGAQPGEIIEYWAVAGPTGKHGEGRAVLVQQQSSVHHTHQEEPIEPSDAVYHGKKHHKSHHSHTEHTGTRPKPRPPAVGHQTGPMPDKEVAEPTHDHSSQSPEESPIAGLLNDSREPSLTPSVMLGGTLAIFAQVYLWGNVFVTLFKPQHQSHLQQHMPQQQQQRQQQPQQQPQHLQQQHQLQQQ